MAWYVLTPWRQYYIYIYIYIYIMLDLRSTWMYINTMKIKVRKRVRKHAKNFFSSWSIRCWHQRGSYNCGKQLWYLSNPVVHSMNYKPQTFPHYKTHYSILLCTIPPWMQFSQAFFMVILQDDFFYIPPFIYPLIILLFFLFSITQITKASLINALPTLFFLLQNYLMQGIQYQLNQP